MPVSVFTIIACTRFLEGAGMGRNPGRPLVRDIRLSALRSEPAGPGAEQAHGHDGMLRSDSKISSSIAHSVRQLTTFSSISLHKAVRPIA